MKPFVFSGFTCLVVLTLCGTCWGQTAPFVPARDAHCVAYSPDGTQVATGTSGPSNAEFPPRPHPNPRRCAVVRIWDVETGRRLYRRETYGDLTQIGFSPDGRLLGWTRLFSPGGNVPLHEVRLLDVSEQEPVRRFHGCHGFAFDPHKPHIAVLSRSRCVLYDLDTGEKFGKVEPLGGALSVTYSPDGRWLAGVQQADGQFVIRVCDPVQGELLAQSPPFDEPFYTLDFSPDATLLASGHPNGLVGLWDPARLDPVGRFSSGGRGLQHPFFSPDGSTLAAGDQNNGDVVFWNLASGKELRRYTFQQGSFRTYYPRASDAAVRPEKDPHRFTFSPDGENFLSGPYGGIIRRVSNGQDLGRFSD